MCNINNVEVYGSINMIELVDFFYINYLHQNKDSDIRQRPHNSMKNLAITIIGNLSTKAIYTVCEFNKIQALCCKT